MTRHLQSAICIIQRTRSIGATRVLRMNEFFKNVEMRRFDSASKPVTNGSWKFSDLGDDPLQQIASQDDGGGFGWWCCGCGHRLWQTIEKNRKFFFRNGSLLMFVVSQPTAFTADSASTFPLKVYGLGLTALGLRLEVYGQKATRHLRTPCLRAKMI